MRELKSIEEKILDRTLYLIGKNSSCNISIRAIAKEAGVNVSAVNYYFRTKEEMLNHAKELYITNTHSITEILAEDDLEDREKLMIATNEIMEYIIRYPGITVLLKDATGKEDEISKKILKVSAEMSEGIINLLYQVLGINEDKKEYRRMIFWSSIYYPFEYHGLNQFDTKVLEEKEARIEYIEYLLETLR